MSRESPPWARPYPEAPPRASQPEGRIAVIDDDPGIRRFMDRAFTRLGWNTDTFASADEAVDAIKAGDYTAALVDLRLPGRNGLWALEQLRSHDPDDMALIMVTGDADVDTAVHCLTHGADDYLVKPVQLDQLIHTVGQALANRRLRMENRAYRETLENLVQIRTADLNDALSELERSGRALERAYRRSLHRLAAASEFRDAETGAHVKRVGLYVQALAKAYGCDQATVRLLRAASPLHDLGKVAVPDSILLKKGPLTSAEFEQMKQHTVAGARILAGPGSKLVKLAREIALTHHEKWDGSGYPAGLAGEEIPLSGRLTAVADVFDAVTTIRVYSGAQSFEDAVTLIEREAGRHFDPQAVNAFVDAIGHIETIYGRYSAPYVQPAASA